MDHRDFLSNPPKLKEQLTNWEISDRFYASLPIIPILFSIVVTTYIIYLTLQNYFQGRLATFTSESKTQLIICWSLSILYAEFMLRSNNYFLTGRAYKIYASNIKSFKDIILNDDWRNNMFSLVLFLGSLLNPALLYTALFLLLSINMHHLITKLYQKSNKRC